MKLLTYLIAWIFSIEGAYGFLKLLATPLYSPHGDSSVYLTYLFKIIGILMYMPFFIRVGGWVISRKVSVPESFSGLRYKIIIVMLLTTVGAFILTIILGLIVGGLSGVPVAIVFAICALISYTVLLITEFREMLHQKAKKP